MESNLNAHTTKSARVFFHFQFSTCFAGEAAESNKKSQGKGESGSLAIFVQIKQFIETPFIKKGENAQRKQIFLYIDNYGMI